jgi:pimeloyl-ACP methyl ester carboxylesterase
MGQGVLLQQRDRLPHLRAEVAEAMVRRILRRMEAPALAQVLTIGRRTANLNPSAVAVPTLVVGGYDDPTGPAAEVRRLAERLPAGRLVQRPDLSHFCQIEQPDQVADCLRGFLAEVLPPRLVSIPAPRPALDSAGTVPARPTAALDGSAPVPVAA